MTNAPAIKLLEKERRRLRRERAEYREVLVNTWGPAGDIAYEQVGRLSTALDSLARVIRQLKAPKGRACK
jgi:hypothetical protein